MTTLPFESGLPIVEPLDPSMDVVEVFRRLSTLPHVVFFDSALRHANLGRYSFIAADPIKWHECPADGSDALTTLATKVANLPNQCVPGLPPFQGGWAGLFGYELGTSLEVVPKARIDEFRVPALAVGLYDVVAAFDHRERTTWLISHGWPETDAAARRERAKSRLSEFRRAIAEGADVSNGHSNFRPILREELAPQFEIADHPGLTSNFSADQYKRAVQRSIDYVYAGDVFQVNLSQRLLHPATSNAADLYCRLRKRNPAPFAGYLDGGGWQVASASPERFVRVDNRHVETRPIKGTRGRARRPEADLFAGDDLRAARKIGPKTS